MKPKPGRSFAVLIVSGLALMFPDSWALGQDASQKNLKE